MAFFDICLSQLAGQSEHHLEFDFSSGHPTLTAEWVYDGECLKVKADRLGMIPIFFWHTSDRLVVADSLAEIVERLNDLQFDDEAVATFLALGYLLGGQTLIAGVKVLLPGETLCWRSGEITRHWEGYPIQKPFAGSRKEAKEEFTRLFNRAIAYRLAGGVGRLPLSGGRDSRHIALELVKQGHPPPATVVCQSAKGAESPIAAQVSKHIGVECLAVPTKLDRLEAEQVKNRLNHYSTDENDWYLDLLPELKGPVFDGLAGDILCNGSYFNSTVAKQLNDSRIADAAYRWLSSPTYMPYLRRKYQKRWHSDLARQALEQAFAPHINAPDPVKSFLFWNRIRREIALLPIAMAGSVAPIYLPYEDPDLLAFCLSLPWPEYGEPGFHDEVIMECYPDAMGIPYSNDHNKPKLPSPAWQPLLRDCVQMTWPLISPMTRPERIFSYLVLAVLTRSTKQISPAFSKMMPVLQAARELKIKF